eukprot:13263907-Ditylum_brightwellii.AAC.1
MREGMAQLTNWLASRLLPWEAYRVLMAYHLIVLDKCPGTWSIGIGKIICWVINNMVIKVTRDKAKVACDIVQLCTMLEDGIKGA